MLFWLFLIPHGLADNGDYFRIIHNRGLSYLSTANEEHFFHYFSNKYRITNRYIENKVSFLSAQSIFIAISVALNKIFNHNIYDIRFIGFLYSVFYLIASYILLKRIEMACIKIFSRFTKRYAKRIAWIFCSLFIFILGDFAYLLYFNSFFGEPLSYVSLLMLIALIIKILEKKEPDIFLLALLTITAIVLATAKQQNTPVGLLISVFMLRLMILKKERCWKTFVVISSLAVVLCSVITYVFISDEIEYINKYHSITLGVMRYADTEERLSDLNIDPQLNILRDTIVYDRYPVVLVNSPLLYDRLYNRVSVVTIGLYYLKHPKLFIRQLQSAASQAFMIRPNMVGNYLKSSGKPPLSKTYFFSGYSILKNYIMPHTVEFLFIFYILFYSAGSYLYYRFYRKKFKEGLVAVEFSMVVGLIGIMQFLIAVLGAGDADLAKHLFLFNVAFDLMFLTLLYAGVYWMKRMFYVHVHNKTDSSTDISYRKNF